MRLLVTSVAGLGHLHPVLPLAVAAARAGHDVRVATGEDQLSWVERCGAVGVAAGLSHAALVQRALSLDVPGPERARALFTTLATPPMAEDLLAIAERWRPDVVLHEEGEYAAPLVASLLGLPCVTQSWSAPARVGAARAFLDEPLAAVWQRFGAHGPVRQGGQPYLDACPSLLQVNDLADVGPHVVPVHPHGFDGPPAPPPAALAALPRPSVYVTLGTEPAFSRPELLQRLVDAAAAAVPGVVVSTGPCRPGCVVVPHDGVRVLQYVPQSHVLPHVDAVVAHGGAGTTAGALLHGRPSLLVPGAAPSQQRCAERVAAAGVGLRLDWAEATPARLRAAVADVVAREDLRTAARAVADAFAGLPGPGKLVEVLEAQDRRRSAAG